MKFDSAYCFVLCCLQLGVFSARDDFMLAYNFVVWSVIAGAAFAAYPWLLSSRPHSAGLRFLPVAARASAIFIVSTAVSFLVLGAAASDHFAEWQLGLFFVAVPSALASILALLISYGVLRVNRNA